MKILIQVNAGIQSPGKVSSVTPLDEVNITNINHSGGSNIFNHDKLPGNGRHPKSFGAVRNNAKGKQKNIPYCLMF
jgi:hypothetical protein